jgi:hypothetical protein
MLDNTEAENLEPQRTQSYTEEKPQRFSSVKFLCGTQCPPW